MRLLVIDTAMEACTVAVARDGMLLAAASEPMARGHQERLAPLAQEIMARAGLGFGELDRIGVAAGPGSFTGLRVGLAFAKGLGLALNRPVVGLGVLEALAVSAPGPGVTAGLIDARRGQVYLQAFRAGPLTPPSAMSHDEAAAALSALAADGPLRLVGSGASLLADRLPGAEIIAMISASPEALAELAAQAPESAGAEPLYLRSPDATPPRPRP